MSDTNPNEVSLYGEGAILSGDLTEAEMALLQNDAEVRDGDDIITIDVNDGDEEGEQEGDPEGDQEGEKGEGEKEDDGEAELPTDDAITASISESVDSLTNIAKDATAKGVDVQAAIDEYYSAGKLSDETFAKFAEAGIDQGVLKALIAGGEAQTQQMYAAIYREAGGKEGFAKLSSFAQANDPAGIDAYNRAVENSDLKTANTILKGWKAQMGAKYGTANKGVQNGKPTGAKAPAVVGYESSAEMVKAMSDPRYRSDAKYRAEVERKTAAML